MDKTSSFAEVKHLLTQLGFCLHKTPQPAWVFEKAEDNALIILPLLKEDESVLPHHLLGIRKLLDERGIMSSDAFEEALTEQRAMVQR